MHVSTLGSLRFSYTNTQEFRGLYREIFKQHQYYVDLETETPLIIDAGAHIGLATLYFKQQYPAGRVVAIEPLPQNLQLLHHNVEMNRVDGVAVIPAALVDQPGPTTIYYDASPDQWWSVAGVRPGSWAGSQQSAHTTVKGMTLEQILDRAGVSPSESIDLCKLDIEGMEDRIIRQNASVLRRVRHLLVEHHPRGEQTAASLLAFLQKNGFASSASSEGRRLKQLDDSDQLVLIAAHRIGYD